MHILPRIYTLPQAQSQVSTKIFGYCWVSFKIWCCAITHLGCYNECNSTFCNIKLPRIRVSTTYWSPVTPKPEDRDAGYALYFMQTIDEWNNRRINETILLWFLKQASVIRDVKLAPSNESSNVVSLLFGKISPVEQPSKYHLWIFKRAQIKWR